MKKYEEPYETKLKRFKENDKKMKEMVSECRNEYFIMLGDLVMSGHSIQSAIDICYKKLILKESCWL